MKDKGYGRIVFTTSSSGLYGNFGQTNYAAAKLGIVGFMNTLKLEAKKYGIKVNCIAPTAATRMTGGLWPPEVLKRRGPRARVPAVVYLCSEDSPNGHILEAGGSYFARVAIVEARGRGPRPARDRRGRGGTVRGDRRPERRANLRLGDGGGHEDHESRRRGLPPVLTPQMT